MYELLKLILLSILPFLELRGSIPYGVFGTSLSLTTIFVVAAVSNILIAPFVYLFIDKVLHLFLRINFIDKLYQKNVVRTQRKIHPLMEKYGLLGLAIFIGIPLPGSGVYSGALAAYLLNIRKRDFMTAVVIGVLVAGVIVLIISVSGNESWQFLIKN